MAAAANGEFDFSALKDLLGSSSKKELYEVIVNAPFEFQAAAAFIFLGIIVFLLVDEKTATIDRIALSDTTHAVATKQVSAKPFNDIRIPLQQEDNLIAKVIRTKKPAGTADWAELFTPELNAEQAHINQANGGIGYSAVYPVMPGKGPRGALIFSYYQYPESIAEQQQNFMDRYVRLVTSRLG